MVVLNTIESTTKSVSNPATGNADKKANLYKIRVMSRSLKSFDGVLKHDACSVYPFPVVFLKRLYALRLDN